MAIPWPSSIARVGGRGSQQRAWNRPMSRRSYLRVLVAAAGYIRRERCLARRRQGEGGDLPSGSSGGMDPLGPRSSGSNGGRGPSGSSGGKDPLGSGDREHPFTGYDLAKLGTHSCKKTAVTMLVEACQSLVVVGSITGTTPSTLMKHYEAPTFQRQKTALNKGLGSMLQATSDSSQQPSGPIGPKGCAVGAEFKFCPMCGRERQFEFRFCPQCGYKF